MKKSVNGTVILLGVFAVLLGWYLIVEQKVRPDREKKQEVAKHLVQLERETIQELEIERKKPTAGPDGAYDVYKLKKTGTDWNIVSPIDDEADSATVGTMIATFTSTQSERTVDETPKDLEAFGLREPALKIRARKDSASPWSEVRVGGDTAVGFNSYVQLDNKPAVHTANRNIKTTFDKELSAIRNKKLFKIDRSDLVSAEFQTSKETFILGKGDGDNWIMARTGLPADTGEVNKTFNAIIDGKAKEFVDNTGKQTVKYGLQRPLVNLTLTLGRDKKKTTLALGKTGDKKAGERFFLKTSERAAITEVEKDLADRLLKGTADYRSSQVVKFNRFTLTRIKVDRKAEPIDLSKKGSDWEVPGEAAFKVDGAQVDNLLTRLQDMKATDFVRLKLTDAEKKSPEMVVHLFEKEGEKESEKITLSFVKRNQLILATRTGLELTMLVKPEEFARMNLTKKEFEKKPEEKKTEDKKASDKKTG